MKILVIKPSSLGDVVHAMPFLKALKDLYPHAHISWVISKGLAELVQGHPLIDDLILFNKDAWRRWDHLAVTAHEIPAFIKTIRFHDFDMVIDLQGLLRSGLITFFARAPLKIGFDTAREGSRYFYNKRVKTQKRAHAVDRYLAVVKELAHLSDTGKQNEPAIRNNIQFPLPIDKSALETVKARLNNRKEYLVLAPSARWETKRWPPEFFGRVIAALPVETVIVGSKSDRSCAKEVLSASGQRGIDLTGQTNLRELAALLSEAKALLSNDSGPIHIAAALGVPVIALFGPTDPKKTGPYGWDLPQSKYHVLRAELDCSPCLRKKCPNPQCHSAVSEKTVIEAVRNYL